VYFPSSSASADVTLRHTAPRALQTASPPIDAHLVSPLTVQFVSTSKVTTAPFDALLSLYVTVTMRPNDACDMTTSETSGVSDAISAMDERSKAPQIVDLVFISVFLSDINLEVI
jgi:hypothetical protein